MLTNGPSGVVAAQMRSRAAEIDMAKDAEFEMFYRSAASTLYQSVSIALGDNNLGQEAVDEAMARAYQRWNDIGRYEKPAGWVYRVAVNWGRTRMRRRRRERPVEQPIDHGFDPVFDPDLDEALNKLSVEARSVVVLRYLHGWSTTEVANALGVPNGTVKSRLSRALEQLKPHLGEVLR